MDHGAGRTLTPARADAEAITAWAAAIPGYSDGPAYAPTALLICES